MYVCVPVKKYILAQGTVVRKGHKTYDCTYVHQRKTTFNRRRPSMEDNIQWKTTFNGRRHSKEDDIQWKMTFNGRRHSMEDDLKWKTTFNGR